MSRVAILGCGAGGQSAAVELTAASHIVHLWNRRESSIAGIKHQGLIEYEGVLGNGTVAPALITTDLAEALKGAEVIVVCLPSIAHRAVFEDLARIGTTLPIVLNPGHTGGALHARAVWKRLGTPMPPLVEFSTLTYVARISSKNVLAITGHSNVVRAGSLPGSQDALLTAAELFPVVAPVKSVLASSLSNVNLVLHPPGAVLGLSWVEATRGDFTFYVEGVTPAVGRVLECLDEERLAVAEAFDVTVLPMIDEMIAIGTADPTADTLTGAIRAGEANRQIKAPDSTRHRYYREDFPYGLLPFVTLAHLASVPVPVAESLLNIAAAAVGDGLLADGLDAMALGVTNVGVDELIKSLTP